MIVYRTFVDWMSLASTEFVWVGSTEGDQVIKSYLILINENVRNNIKMRGLKGKENIWKEVLILYINMISDYPLK